MIYYVRHGKTLDNVKRIVTGKIDIALSEEGIEEAKNIAEELKNVKFDVCYCSTLLRAKQTLKEIIKYHKELKINFDERITPREYGDFTGKYKKDLEKLEDYKNRYKIGYKLTTEGLEQTTDFMKRANKFYNEILEKHKNKNILIVSHGSFARASYTFFNGLPKYNDLNNTPIKNSSEVAIYPINFNKELTI